MQEARYVCLTSDKLSHCKSRCSCQRDATLCKSTAGTNPELEPVLRIPPNHNRLTLFGLKVSKAVLPNVVFVHMLTRQLCAHACMHASDAAIRMTHLQGRLYLLCVKLPGKSEERQPASILSLLDTHTSQRPTCRYLQPASD